MIERLARAATARAGCVLSRLRATPRGLRAKVVAFTCGIAAMMAAGNVAIEHYISHRVADERTSSEMLDLAVGFARMAAVDAISSSAPDASLAARIANLSPTVDDAYLLDREGRIVVEAHETEDPRLGRALRAAPVLRTIVERKATVVADGEEVIAAAPVVGPRGDVTGYVVLQGADGFNPRAGDAAIVAAVLSLALGAFLATWIGIVLTRPIEMLSSAAERIVREDFSRPVGVNTRDEFRSLAEALNRLMARTATLTTAYGRAQADLAAALSRAEAASRAKSEFLAGMSCELRAPLNAIVGFSDLLTGARSSSLAEPKRREYARDISRAGRHLLNLVSGILDYAQVDTGRATLAEADIDIGELVQAIVSSLDSLADDTGVMLSADVAPGMPMVRCDGERLTQALENLILNAVQSTRAGGYVTVTLTRGDHGTLELRIADNGIGIAGKDLEKALTPFGRLDKQPAARARGLGLGLPLARKLIELHGGIFRIESYADVGTVVTVRLPADRVVEQLAPALA